MAYETMENAPHDRFIVVFNSVVGEYVTKYNEEPNKQWPCTFWGRPGIWFPSPSGWMEITTSFEIESDRAMLKAVTFYWCSTHNRDATHEDEHGRKCCDPKLDGIMIPCIVKKATPVLFEEYEDGWCNPCPDMSDILHFFDKKGQSLCRKWKRCAGIVEKNPTEEKYLCKRCLQFNAEHKSTPTAP